MNGGKLPDGGILYDGTEEDDDDVVVEPETTRAGIEIDWHVDGLDETGLAVPMGVRVDGRLGPG